MLFHGSLLPSIGILTVLKGGGGCVCMALIFSRIVLLIFVSYHLVKLSALLLVTAILPIITGHQRISHKTEYLFLTFFHAEIKNNANFSLLSTVFKILRYMRSLKVSVNSGKFKLLKSKTNYWRNPIEIINL